MMKSKPVRHRVVSFRISNDEYEALEKRAMEMKYRSLSDMARSSVFANAGLAVDQVKVMRRILDLEKEVTALALAAGRRVELG